MHHKAVGYVLIFLCVSVPRTLGFIPGLFDNMGGLGGSAATNPFSTLFGGSGDMSQQTIGTQNLVGSGSSFDNMLSGFGSTMGGLFGGPTSSVGSLFGGATGALGGLFSPPSPSTGAGMMGSLFSNPFDTGFSQNPLAGLGVQMLTGNKMCKNPAFLRRCGCSFFCQRGTVDYGQCEDHRENSFLPRFCCPDSVHLMCVGME